MRSESEMLLVVHQLADRSRRRRRTALVASSALLVVLVSAAAFAFRSHPGGGETVQAQATEDPTSTSAAPNDTVPAPDPTGTDPSSTDVTSGQPGSDPGSPVTPTIRSTSPPTSIPDVTTTSYPVYDDCDPALVTASLTTDQASYSPGEVVHVRLRYRNDSAVPCSRPNGGFGFEVTSDDGRLMAKVMIAVTASRDPWLPGTETGVDLDWGQECIPDVMPPCPGGIAPAGTYHLTDISTPTAKAQIALGS